MVSPDQKNTPRVPEMDLPFAKVVQRYDTSANTLASPAAGGKDQVDVDLEEGTTVPEFIKSFWLEIGNPDIHRFNSDELIGEITYKAMRTQIKPGDSGRVIVSILGNFEPLTEPAKAWLKENTQLEGSLD